MKEGLLLCTSTTRNFMFTLVRVKLVRGRRGVTHLHSLKGSVKGKKVGKPQKFLKTIVFISPAEASFYLQMLKDEMTAY